MLLSTVKSGTEDRLCGWEVWYHAWGVFDEVSQTWISENADGWYLDQYLHDVDEECHREVELAVKRVMEKEGVTEQLKKENPLEWVQRVNVIKARAGEQVIDNVFCF